MRDRHVVLWDRDCGFCRRSVAWIERNDPQGRFECQPYQEWQGAEMTEALAADCARAVHVVCRDGRVLRAGRAVLFVVADLRWPTICRVLSWPPFVWGVEVGYAIVARNRQFFSRFLFRAAVP